MRSLELQRRAPAVRAALPIATLALLLLGAESRAATRQYFYRGAVASSTFAPLPAGTPFTGHYRFDDAATDTDASLAVGAYATGSFHVDWGPAIGWVTFDQAGGTRVQNDVPVFFGCSDLFALTAGAGARDTPAFANALLGGSGVTFQDFSPGCAPAPDALADDSLTGVPQLLGDPWGAGDQNVVLALSATGGGCPPFTSSCFATLAIAELAPAYLLRVVRTGSGEGSVASDPFGIACGATCEALLGGTVELAPTASVGSRFAGWEGCDSVVADHCFVELTADREVEARFQIVTAQEIPTLSSVGLALLALALSLIGWSAIRRVR